MKSLNLKHSRAIDIASSIGDKAHRGWRIKMYLNYTAPSGKSKTFYTYTGAAEDFMRAEMIEAGNKVFGEESPPWFITETYQMKVDSKNKILSIGEKIPEKEVPVSKRAKRRLAYWRRIRFIRSRLRWTNKQARRNYKRFKGRGVEKKIRKQLRKRKNR